MATIIPPKSAGPPTISTLKLGNKSLKLTIYESRDSYTLFIGGHELYCIECMIYKPDSAFVTRLGFPLNVGRLSQIYYNINCSLEGNFQRGIDTLRILETLCEYIRKNYKYVDTISLMDASYRTCDDGQEIELSEMTYLRIGKTWYEKNYGAFMDTKDLPKFNEMERRLQMAKINMTWDVFRQFIAGEFPLPEKDLQDLYETASTWQEFFGPLSEKMGIAQFCIFAAPWLHKFFWTLSSYSFSSATYYIPLKNINTINYKSMPYVRGGKKFTRKRLRQRKRNYQ